MYAINKLILVYSLLKHGYLGLQKSLILDILFILRINKMPEYVVLHCSTFF